MFSYVWTVCFYGSLFSIIREKMLFIKSFVDINLPVIGNAVVQVLNNYVDIILRMHKVNKDCLQTVYNIICMFCVPSVYYCDIVACRLKPSVIFLTL